mmetsp:Transcript_18830/g.21030  ORF Transcript_18830/g.21030 Transcript_18830/m.21030 type:complete len:643 (-) Transcript_18830:27-1955(-)|eukprot:CAMPEP_0205830474 /NCGR_PEP_ID=MMETSP0206-20130828/41151_1 /ASSEMBLY_ACC=CAM_ASM_000279 /TAXON_ID=36767 /ORGANISM="Euplotes focardii, Strain TN1" /LENGTH=642 /DNA_ID=CAMNT_0053134155 /DNA_START=18 /DNA_END=1946 /DNA_ORIENTATION=-
MAFNFADHVDITKFQPLEIDPWAQASLTAQQKRVLQANIQLCRDIIVFFTATGGASGYGGHTGGAFDTTPEVMILDSFFRGRPDKFVPIFYDEAGHRVATQYLMSALRGDLNPNELVYYRQGHKKLPGHPELGLTPGVQFSSGRLGHMWPYVNGVALANPDKIVFCLGSDGSQQEGDDAEAARLAVAQNLNVKLLIDDNDVTIAGHPSQYMRGYSVSNTLRGHGLPVAEVPGEDLDALYYRIRTAVVTDGPYAVISKRKMAPGIKGIEGSTHGHDVINKKAAVEYLEGRGLHKAAAYLKTIKGTKDPHGEYLGSGKRDANRKLFGKIVSDILDTMTLKQRVDSVKVIDCDLEGSTGLNVIHKRHPEVFVLGGIMERGNLSAAAGFGREKGKQGIFSTFAAFLEMCCSEITMARLNNSNLLCHFSHSGVDDMADNTCHFGLNNFFADNGLEYDKSTRLYFPADSKSFEKCIKSVYFDEGLRFVFSTRSKLPLLLKEDGSPVYGDDYKFQSGVDDVIREGADGYIVSFGDATYRCLDAVERLKKQGINVGLINKTTLNIVDEAMMKKVGAAPFVLVVESLSYKNGLGVRFGTWLLERGLSPKFARIGTHEEGCGGLWQQAYHQGYDSKSVVTKVKQLVGLRARL